MTDDAPAPDDDDDKSPVDKLLSRFGPVPAVDPDRRPPGPRPGEESTHRPAPVERVPADAEARAPLFDEPHDEVFGDTLVRVEETFAQGDLVYDTEVEPLEVIDRRDWVRIPRRSGPAFRFLVVALFLGFAVSTVYTRATTWYDEQLDPPGNPGSPVAFAIPEGATANEVTQDLYASDVIANPTLFRYWLRDNFTGDFQAGDYACLQQGMSFQEAIDCLDGIGPVPPQFFSITIPEGLRLTEIIDVLNRENPGYTRESLTSDLAATLVTVDLTGVPRITPAGAPDPTGSGKEGLLFPATYQIDDRRGADTLDILTRMAETMELKYNEAVDDLGRDQIITDLGLTDYEVLTVASLIEEEAVTQEDRPKIARVIYNRLALNRDSLGIDATACYAAQKSCADLTVEDLDSPSPWNTRNQANLGLPPTPIAAPGEASIRAALAPEPGEWYFYVRTEEDGGHTFAVTNEEFNAAKAICQERGYC